jgi:tetratricopeptide (TPR) repeat protein
VKRYRGGFAIVAAAVALGVSSPARADGGEANASNAQTEITNVDREAGAVQSAVERSKAQKLSAEQRLANGDLLYRSKDYQRAIVVFSELLEEFPPTTVSYPDALWLRGETYYATKEYLSARRDYRALVEQSSQPRFSPYLGRSLARLVDVCLRIGDIKSLDEVFAKLSQVPPAQVDAALVYAKGKAHFARKNWGEAKAAFESVPMGTEYTHQAKYFLGLVSMRTTAPSLTADGKPSTAPTNYKPAIELFRQVTDLPADSDAHKQVIDLSFMAMGRLFYEMENYVQASEAYARVGRESSEFGTMLYELAWVYVRLGDVQRAERALEVLQVADPGSPLVGDASLLRGDLLLRAGAFDRAQPSAARRPRSERSDPVHCRALGPRGRRRYVGICRHRRREPVQEHVAAVVQPHRQARGHRQRGQPRAGVPRTLGRRRERPRASQPIVQGSPRCGPRPRSGRARAAVR